MKRTIAIALILLGVCITAHAAQVDKAYTFDTGQTISSANVNKNFDDIYNEFNGSVEGGASGNIAADTLTEREMSDEINPRVRWDEGFRDFVYSGLLATTTSGTLTTTTTSGTTYVEGYRVNKASGTNRTYTASKDTYVDLSTGGTFTYSEVARAAAAPSTAANSIRLFAATSNASEIEAVTDLRVLTPYVSTGKVLQVVYSNSLAGANSTADTVPLDNTPPLTDEGIKFLSAQITPTQATSYLVIEATLVTNRSTANPMVAHLHKNATGNALASVVNSVSSTGDWQVISLRYTVLATDTNSQTWDVYAGPVTDGTLYVNTNAAGATLGGTIISSITVTEYDPA